MRSALLAGSIWALSVSQVLAGVQYGGVNIAGFDFGCEIDVQAPLLLSPQLQLTERLAGNM